MIIEDCAFTIEFTSSTSVENEVENFLTEIEGRIICHSENEVAPVGTLRAFYADLEGAIDHGEHPYDVLDVEHATELYYSALYDARSGGFKESVRNLFGDEVFYINLLILDRLEILPEYRGKSLGLACLYRCVQQYGHGCGLAALKPFPLQFEAIYKPDEWRQRLLLQAFGTDQKACARKLVKYYQRLGFVKVPRTEVMALDPSCILSPFRKEGSGGRGQTNLRGCDGGVS